MATSRPHSSAGNTNKWAPSSKIVEERNKARELSRALERAANDLKAIDRQFQLLDDGLLSEEEMKRFAGKSFFQKDKPPKRFQYIEAAETRQKNQRQEERRLEQRLSLKRQRVSSSSSGVGATSLLSSSPLAHPRTSSPLKTLTHRPLSPYSNDGALHHHNNADHHHHNADPNDNANATHHNDSTLTSTSMVTGTNAALSSIRDDRVEEERQHHRGGATRISTPTSSPDRRRRRHLTRSQQATVQKKKEAQEKKRAKQSRHRMAQEDALSSRYRAREQQQRHHLDQLLFVFYAARFGPLDGVLYAQTEMPGVLYEKLVTDGCLAVQRWWHAIWPERAMRKREAANFMQKMYRGAKSRKNYKKEAQAKRAMRYFFHRQVGRCVRTWKIESDRAVGVRKLLHRIKHGCVLLCFEGWGRETRAVLEERRRLIAPVYNRIVNRLLVLTFQPWKCLWEKALRVKNMMRKSLLGRKGNHPLLLLSFFLFLEKALFFLVVVVSPFPFFQPTVLKRGRSECGALWMNVIV